MSFIKKTWLARLGVGLNRFRMNNSSDVILESNPISVTQQGDQLSADNMNNLETRIGNAFDEMAGNLATIEVSPSQHNWTVGSQIVYNGILYKVTSAISTGDNLVVGTNIEPYPVSSALSDISNYSRRTRKNITNNLANLSTAIAEQNLEKYGYTIGDYFVGASGYTYYLADMDCNYGGYDSYAVVSTHHCGVVVDTHTTSKWADSVTKYSSSILHTYLSGTVLNNIKSDFNALFGGWSNHLIARTELDNSVGGWGTTWEGLANCLICAMTEVQVYGSRVFGCDGFQTGTGSKPLELFMKYRFNEIYGNTWIWLKSVYSASVACGASSTGDAGNNGVSNSYGVSGLILFK